MKGDKVVELAEILTDNHLFGIFWNIYILIVQIIFIEVTDSSISASNI